MLKATVLHHGVGGRIGLGLGFFCGSFTVRLGIPWSRGSFRVQQLGLLLVTVIEL